MKRQCSRPGCAEEATDTLTYHYASSVAWLDVLSDERDPHGYDLCARHSGRLRVPHGWRLEDRRAHLTLAGPQASGADAASGSSTGMLAGLLAG